MQIHTLVENSSGTPTLKGEFGLSLLVQSREKTILFDMGGSSLFRDNGFSLGFDPCEVDCAVVSHGHYDHGGGLETFLKANRNSPVYLAKGADGWFYGNVGARLPSLLFPLFYPLVGKKKRFSRYVGIDRSVFTEYEDRLVFIDDDMEVSDGIYLLTDIDRRHPAPQGNMFLFEERKGVFGEDTFTHELLMVIREEDGLVVFTGCGHRGIVNIIETVKGRFPGEKIKGAVGGFHLGFQPGGMEGEKARSAALQVAHYLHKSDIDTILTGHCTGDQPCTVLHNTLGAKFSRLRTGLSFTV